MTKQEMLNLIADTTQDVISKNAEAVDNNFNPAAIEMATQLATITTIEVLRKIGIVTIEKE